jgi:hypothetical protein
VSLAAIDTYPCGWTEASRIDARALRGASLRRCGSCMAGGLGADAAVTVDTAASDGLSVP